MGGRTDEAGGDFASPLATRYATPDMLANFSERRRALLWRDLWIALATAERELGLPILSQQIDALRACRDEIDFERIVVLELALRYDVMAHVRHYGELAGHDAEKVIHLGATSCYVTDNADLVMMRDGLELMMDRVFSALEPLRSFAVRHRSVPTLAYTHFQPAQLTTVGKRACMWAQDLAFDLQTLSDLRGRLWFRGAKGTTGTQASFLALFEGDHGKVRALDQHVCTAMGFERSMPVTGQTYTRKLDTWVVSTLADVAGSAAKIANDIRLLAHEREIEEPFEDAQVGSSAMAYKRNPMRSERIVGLARFVHSLSTSPRETHANQWLERTLDDSANRRLVVTEAFLATDAILNLLCDVLAGLIVNEAVIAHNVTEQMPFMMTENLIMRGSKAGKSRQELHEHIRQLSHAALRKLKQGHANDLGERLASDPVLAPFFDARLVAPDNYIGRAPEQVDEFMRDYLDPMLTAHVHRRGRFRACVRV